MPKPARAASVPSPASHSQAASRRRRTASPLSGRASNITTWPRRSRQWRFLGRSAPAAAPAAGAPPPRAADGRGRPPPPHRAPPPGGGGAGGGEGGQPAAGGGGARGGGEAE